MAIEEKVLRNAVEALVEADLLPPDVVSDLISSLRQSCEARMSQGRSEVEALSESLHDLRSIIDSAPETYQARPLRQHRPIGIFILAIACWSAFYWIASMLPNFRDLFLQMGMERLPISSEITMGLGRICEKLWLLMPLPIGFLLFLIVRQKAAKRPVPLFWHTVALIACLALLALVVLTVASVFFPAIELQKKLGGG